MRGRALHGDRKMSSARRGEAVLDHPHEKKFHHMTLGAHLFVLGSENKLGEPSQLNSRRICNWNLWWAVNWAVLGRVNRQSFFRSHSSWLFTASSLGSRLPGFFMLRLPSADQFAQKPHLDSRDHSGMPSHLQYAWHFRWLPFSCLKCEHSAKVEVWLSHNSPPRDSAMTLMLSEFPVCLIGECSHLTASSKLNNEVMCLGIRNPPK